MSALEAMLVVIIVLNAVSLSANVASVLAKRKIAKIRAQDATKGPRFRECGHRWGVSCACEPTSRLPR